MGRGTIARLSGAFAVAGWVWSGAHMLGQYGEKSWAVLALVIAANATVILAMTWCTQPAAEAFELGYYAGHQDARRTHTNGQAKVVSLRPKPSVVSARVKD